MVSPTSRGGEKTKSNEGETSSTKQIKPKREIGIEVDNEIDEEVTRVDFFCQNSWRGPHSSLCLDYTGDIGL